MGLNQRGRERDPAQRLNQMNQQIAGDFAEYDDDAYDYDDRPKGTSAYDLFMQPHMFVKVRVDIGRTNKRKPMRK